LFVPSLVFAVLAIPAIASAQAGGGLQPKTGGLVDSPNSVTIGYIGKYFHGETFEDEFSTPGQYYGGIDIGYQRRIKKMDKADLGVVGGVQFCFHSDETAMVYMGGVVYTRQLTTTVKFFVEAEAGVWHEGDNNFALRFDAGPEFHVGDCERMTVRPFAGVEPVFFGGGHETAFAFGANVRLRF
jgi:hypothetical protein